MAFRAVTNRELHEILSFTRKDRSLPSMTAARERHRSAFAAEHASASNEDGNCLQGMACAIGIEAAAALFCYGLWQFTHLAR